MLNGNVYYHGAIRKSIIAFGRLFSNIYIDRKEGDSVTGNTVQRLHVPLAYAPKEKWLVRLEQDPSLENYTMVSLPRLSFEIIGYMYDPSRKLNRMEQLRYSDGSGSSTNTVFTPVPYNIDLSLYIISNKQEDGLQILEQILPTFTPEYTMKINMIPEMNITTDVPIVLNSVSVSDEYDGDFQTRRFVTHTLSFQMKLNLFGPGSNKSVIDHVNVDIGQNEDFTNPNRTFVADGDTSTTTISNESWEFNF